MEEGNKLIAEFMGVEPAPEGEVNIYMDGEEMKEFGQEYHSSWDWLHEAFDKFKTMQLREWETSEGIAWNHKYSFHLCQIGTAIVHNPIEEAFNRLVIGIEWYNKNQ